MIDVAKDRYANNIDNAKNGQVIKAVLLNAADKPDGWNNGQTGSVPFTTNQALDYTFGAGLLNASKCFTNFTEGTNDVPGFDGSDVIAVGWDFGIVSQNSENDYFLIQELVGGTTFTATLNWFLGREWNGTAEPSGIIDADDNYFTDLSLDMYRVVDGAPVELIASSDAQFINTEHFHFDVPQTGNYMLKVRWMGERYDTIGNSEQTYGLAWSGTWVPLLGDVNRDGLVNLLDVTPFVELLSSQGFQSEADINEDGVFNLLDRVVVEVFAPLIVRNRLQRHIVLVKLDQGFGKFAHVRISNPDVWRVDNLGDQFLCVFTSPWKILASGDSLGNAIFGNAQVDELLLVHGILVSVKWFSTAYQSQKRQRGSWSNTSPRRKC